MTLKDRRPLLISSLEKIFRKRSKDAIRHFAFKHPPAIVTGRIFCVTDLFASSDDVEVTTNKDKAKWAFSTVKNFITGVIIPLVDIGTDLFAAGTHFWWGDVTWGCLTLLFVGMPGFVCGLTIAGTYTD